MNLSAVIADARKALAAFTGAAGEILALGLLHGTAERWVSSAVAVATALAVYGVPNGRKPAAPVKVRQSDAPVVAGPSTPPVAPAPAAPTTPPTTPAA